MGGNTEQQEPFYTAENLPRRDLVYRTEGEDEPRKEYSDSYSQKMLEEERKKREELLDALARLGILDQLAPSGFVPRVPYKPIDQQFSF